jgi:hypothetical protein
MKYVVQLEICNWFKQVKLGQYEKCGTSYVLHNERGLG